MSGLLDKASAAKKAEEAEEPPKKKEIEGKAIEMKADGRMTSLDAKLSVLITQRMSKIGLILGFVGFILMFFLGNYTLEDLTGPVPFGLVVLAILIGSFVLVWNSVDRTRTVPLVVVYLLLAGIPYGTGLIGGGFVGITDIAYSEDGDDLTFKIRGSFNSVDVAIHADGTEVWSGSGDLSNELKNFRVPVEEFFSGNGEQHDGKTNVAYTIVAESSNGLTNEVEISSRLTTREAQDAAVRIDELQDSNDADAYLGITIEIMVGLINPNYQNSDGGGFQAVGLRPMNGDYTVDVTVTGGDEWSESTISVDEDLATWVSQSSGTGSATTAGWFGLTGSDTDNNGVLYLDKSEFYNDPGCYSFQVDIVNEVGSGEVFSSTWSWELDLSDGDGQNSINKGIGVGDTC